MNASEPPDEMARLRKRAEREHRARQEAELLAEQGIRQLYERQKELALFNTITDAANGATSVHAAIQVTLDEICSYTNWPVGHAYFVGDEPDLLVSGRIWHLDQPEVFSNFRKITEATQFRPGEGLPGRVLESRRSVWIADVSKDANFPRAKHSIDIGVRAAFAFPVLAGTAVMAVLEFFSCDEIELRESWLKIAAQAGIQLGRIFERQRATSELEKVHAELLEANRLKSEFLANMSHEIRTPMNGVVGMTELLLMTDLTQEQRELIRTVRVSGESLLVIINDILDFSKIEAGKLDLHITDFELREVIDDMMDSLAPLAHGKGLELAALIRPEVPPRLRGDSGRLRQVLSNLVGNAVKFTSQGEVILTLSVVSENPTHVALVFEVRDSGIGIEPGVQRRLFQAFSQADGSSTRKYGGTGLGLVISKKLVTLMNGDIQVSSEPGKGSAFSFTIEFPKQADALKPDPPRELSGLHVLIVDDNATSRKILEQYTRTWSMKATLASTGQEALELLRRAASATPYALVILDQQMPEMDGLMLARAIKDDPSISSTRLIVLTSLGSLVTSEKMEKAGIERSVLKPVKESRLLECVVEVMASPMPLTQERSRTVNRLIESTKIPPVDFTRKPVRVLLAEDNVINQKVAVKMLGKIGCPVDVANNGLEVLAALDRQPYDLIFMDCQMPELDGYETALRIRARPDGGTLRIVALTANAMSGEIQRCLDFGMDDHLSKPVRLEALREMVVRWTPLESIPVISKMTGNRGPEAPNVELRQDNG